MRTDSKCQGSGMLFPLETGVFLFKYVYWSDNSEGQLEMLSSNFGAGEREGM